MAKATNSDIVQLKEALKNAEDALARWNALLPEREALENSIQEMLGQIEVASAAMRQQQKNNPKLALHIAQEIKQHEDFLAHANMKKQALDHLLDACEECSEETIELIRTRLVEAILKRHPNLRTEYEHFALERSRISALHAELREIAQVCANLGDMLKIVLDTRQKVRRQWVLSYLFGKNPNAIISQQLHNAEILCDAALTSLEQHQTSALKNAVLKELHIEITGFLKELRKHCKQRWGFKTVDTTFAKLANTLAGLRDTVDTHLGIIEKAQSNLDKKYSTWFNKAMGDE